jgi:glycine dehydrogenase subunit 1
VSAYTSLTEDDLREMLAAIGAASIDELFAEVPEGVRLGRPLDLPPGLPEQEVAAHLAALADRNTSADDELTFLGGGMYDHYVPALIDSILARSEFLTPYTPYQPEISQGGLQVMFEYQTAISELTGLPVSNASLYEGPSAVGSAAYLAKLANGRGEVVVSRGVHPHSRATLRTLAPGYGQEVSEAPLAGGATDLGELLAMIGPATSAVILQQPNFLGALEDLEPMIAAAREAGALAVVACDPLPLALLRSPGEMGADVAVGEGQSLGNRLDYGGPSFGFMAAREEHIRRMPGRIAGETRDVDGRRGFVLTLQTREQHIRRERATHNICTAQVLNALAGVIYLSWLGKRGAVELAELMLRRADYARTTLAALPGVRALHDQPIARELALALDAPVEAVIERCAAEGVNPGLALGAHYPEHPDGLLVAVTERRGRADIDRLADVLGRAVAAESPARAAVETGAVA